MDDSQSSDVFSISGEIVYENNEMDTAPYESLLSNAKMSLSKNVSNEIARPTFFNNFAKLLNDCESCVSQSLNLAVGLLSTDEFMLEKLCEYLEDAVCLLQLLSCFIKNVVESVSMACCKMRTFPTTTGRIIMMVYSHCRDSETLYGSYLKTIEKQLKDFFRSCHELQLTYLMVLEKHFTFDLIETEELDVLIEVLDINLKIGEIVQTLDVKTMAEQWKAYMMICEKYSHYLMDKHIYYNCTKLLCKMIENNVQIAFETEQEEKIVLRSLKVASFTLKILLKIIIIFKHATVKEFSHIVDLLINLNTFQEKMAEKSLHFKNLFSTNITVPVEAVMKEIVKDEQFVNTLPSVMIDKLENELQLGYIGLLISTIKAILQNDDQIKSAKANIIIAIFKILPYGHIWFNTGLKYPVITQTHNIKTYGLYEHLLTHTLALAMTMGDEISLLELKMYEAVLGTDCMSALFASNLWILLARICPQQYLLNQVTSLCKVYQKLDENALFRKSPQSTHLSYVLKKLFEALNEQSKMKIFKYFDVNEGRNTSIWIVLKINNLPMTVRNSAQELVFERTEAAMNKLLADNVNNVYHMQDLIDSMKLAATCDGILEEVTLKAWLNICPKIQNPVLFRKVDKSTVWFLEFVEALVAMSKEEMFSDSYNVVKILHVVSGITEIDNTELKLLLVELACKLSICESHDEHRNLIRNLIKQTFTNLLRNSDNIVRNMFFNILRRYTPHRNIDSVLIEVISGDEVLEEIWKRIKNASHNDNIEHLRKTFSYKFSHKCIRNYEKEQEEIIISGSSVSAIEKTSSNNFDFVDIDTLFDTEDESEPASKKAKLNNSKVEELISRLEADAWSLSNMKENVGAQEKSRVRHICEQLRNIVE